MAVEVEDPKKVARKIAKKLGEKEFRVRKIIEELVNYFGVDLARDLLKQTLEIEKSGGMLTPEGDRRRTPGGVFIFLAKQQLPQEARKTIIYYRRPKKQAETPISTKSAPIQTSENTPPAIEAPKPLTATSTIPPEVAEKLTILHRSAERLREKIAALEASGQQAGLVITRRLLESAEQQIAEIERLYSG